MHKPLTRQTPTRGRSRAPTARSGLGDHKLTIAGRDKSKLIAGLDKQVGLVQAAIADIMPETPVRGALCFVDADLPRRGTPASTATRCCTSSRWPSASTPTARSPPRG
jgi:hypothetical protein